MAFASRDRTIAQTRAFHAALSKAFYYPVIAPEGLINGRGYQALRPPRLADALGIFELYVANHPMSANAVDSVGDGYLPVGDRAKAAAAFGRALELSPLAADTARNLASLKSGLSR